MAIALLGGGNGSVGKAGTGNSAAIDTSGATLLVAMVASQAVSASATRSDLDSKGNTWTRIGSVLTQPTTFNMQSAIYYVDGSPTVGSGHTFNDSAETTPAIAVLAFSGTATSSALDANRSEAADQVTPAAAGSITPSANNEVVVFGVGGFDNAGGASMNGGFTLQVQIVGAGGSNYSASIGYLVQTTATAANPTFTWGSGRTMGAHLVAFQESGGGGGGGAVVKPFTLTLMGIQ